MQELTKVESTKGVRSIVAMMIKHGTADMYIAMLKDMFNMVLLHQDEIGMSDSAAIGSLQAITMLCADIRNIVADRNLAQLLGVSSAERSTEGNLDEESAIELIFPDL